MNPARQPRFAGRPGFTLIELLLVVAITLTLAGLTGVAFSRSYRAGRLRTSARDFIALGRYARARAVLDGRPAVLRIDPASGRAEIWLQAEPAQTDTELAEDAEALVRTDGRPYEPAGVRRELPERLYIVRMRVGDEELVAGQKAEIRFFPTGASESALLRIEDENERWMELALDQAGNWTVSP